MDLLQKDVYYEAPPMSPEHQGPNPRFKYPSHPPASPGILMPNLPVPPSGSHHDWTSSPPENPRKRWEDTQTGPNRPVDPLVLDLNRDGKVEFKNAAYFDLNANGFHEYTRWIDKTDAFLVLDKNFNGKADDGSELFGDAMILPDGSRAKGRVEWILEPPY